MGQAFYCTICHQWISYAPGEERIRKRIEHRDYCQTEIFKSDDLVELDRELDFYYG